MNNILPLVSIVVRTHNRQDLLKQALECLLAQTYRPIEIWVIDHDSTDNTAEIVSSFGNQNIMYYKHQGNYRDTFNVWRDKIRGEYVSFLDDDDYLKPQCLEKLAHFLIAHDDIDVVFPRHRIFESGADRCTMLYDTDRIASRDIKKKLLTWNVIPWNGALMRKSCLKKIPPIDSAISGAYDWFFWVYAAVNGCRFYQVDSILGLIRKSPDSVQFSVKMMSQGGLQCIKYYGSQLSLKEKFRYGFPYAYGSRLIRHGIFDLENEKARTGRTTLLKGLCLFMFSARGRMRWIAGLLIWFASLISDGAKARNRIEKLYGKYLFRNYFEIQSHELGK